MCFINWLIKKLVTYKWKHDKFIAWSWGVNEVVDLHIISEESYLDKHRFGGKVEVYNN